MFKSNFFVFVLLSFLIGTLSCDQQKKTEKESPGRTYEVEEINFTKTQRNCESNCAGIIITYPKLKDESYSEVNTSIKHIIKEELLKHILETDKDLNIEDLSESFIATFEDFKKEFPDVKTPWTIEINSDLNYVNRAFLSLSTDTYSYTGGAHPNRFVQYINIDPQSGKRIEELSFFINNEEKLKDLVERSFRKKYNIPQNGNLAEAGFQFEDNTFALTNNYGFSKAGMVFYYNSYEIAPYAEGPTEIRIPFHELKGIYKHKTL